MMSVVKQMAPQPWSSRRLTNARIVCGVRKSPPVVTCHQAGPLPDSTSFWIPPLVICSVLAAAAARATVFSPSG